MTDEERSLKLICGPEVGCGDGGTFIVRTPSQKEIMDAFSDVRAEATLAEREACAKVAYDGMVACGYGQVAGNVAAAIRASTPQSPPKRFDDETGEAK